MSTPFESIEGAHEYLSLLADTVDEVSATIEGDIAAAQAGNAQRRVEALRLVEYKLAQLHGHLSSGRLILNDLRSLRRLILRERHPDSDQA